MTFYTFCYITQEFIITILAKLASVNNQPFLIRTTMMSIKPITWRIINVGTIFHIKCNVKRFIYLPISFDIVNIVRTSKNNNREILNKRRLLKCIKSVLSISRSSSQTYGVIHFCCKCESSKICFFIILAFIIINVTN